MTTVKDFLGMTFNPRHRQLGMVSWGGFVLFEFFAPIIEFVGWFVIPTARALGHSTRQPSAPCFSSPSAWA